MRLARLLAPIGVTVLLITGFVVGRAPTARAAAITVNTTADELNGDGDCALREAAKAANTDAAVDACPAGDPAPAVDVITFGVTGTIGLAAINGPLVVTGDVVIDGPGAASLTISGSHSTRVIRVDAGATLNLSDVTIANGYFVSSPQIAGAGILNYGTLSVSNSVVSGNDAGGGCCSGLPGGGIGNSGGAVTVTNSTFSGNSAGGEGGGIYSENGALDVSGTSFSGNSTNNWGGGIFVTGGTLSVSDSTFDGNSDVYSGGGIGMINSATATISGSTFSGNTTTFAGGGGIWNYTGTLTVINSTFSGNTATFAGFSQGGAIQNYEGTAVVTNSTFSGNAAGDGGGLWNAPWTSASSFTLQNSIVANSSSGGNCSGPIADGGGNLTWPDTTCPGSNVDPKLDPAGLQDHGGLTKTIALQVGSPAIDAAVSANCPSGDQRGVDRPQGAGCDDGAWEMPVGVAEVTVDPQASLRPTGRVRVTGGIVCGPPGDGFRIFVRVDQSSTGAVSGIGKYTSACSGDLHDPWFVTPPKKSGSPPFAAGAARACWQARTYSGTTETDRVTLCISVTIV